jgi:DNA-binding transcriptional ArsR family regulator
MENNQPQLTDDGSLETLAAYWGVTREQILRQRWRFLRKRPATTKLFHLLRQRGEMYKTEIATALGVTPPAVDHAISTLKRWKTVDIEQRGSRTYFRLRPGMAEQYQQWLASQQSEEAEP